MASLVSGSLTILGSMIVAMLGFFVGARVGKETRDRALMRDKYSTLYEYLFDLIETAKSNYPKTWASFAKAPNSEPPIFHMKRTGEEALFPAALFEKISDCEKSLIVAGGKFKFLDEKINKFAYDEFMKFGGQKTISGTGPMNTLEPKKIIRLEEEECRSLARSIFASDAVGLSLHGDKIFDRQCIMKSEITEEILAEFIVSFRAKLLRDSNIKSSLDDLNAATKDCEMIMAEIRARIAEPHHFRETVEAAFRDPLRRRFR